MKSKRFEITGRSTRRPDEPAFDDTMEQFIAGTEAMTTMTVQIPERLKRALKRAALDRDTTIKDLLIEILEGHFAATKQ